MIVRDDVESCRKGMTAYLGKRVRLKSSGGRKRTIIHDGILESCYPNVFTVRCDSKYSYPEMISFSYVDILTKVVEVAVESKVSDECDAIEEVEDSAKQEEVTDEAKAQDKSA